MKVQKRNTFKNYLSGILMLATTGTVSAQDLVSHDFNDNTLGPFEVCTTGSPNYSKVVNNRLKTFWTESAYNGTRTYRGAEACGDQFYTYKEGWYGMNLELGSDYPKNKKAGIAQVFGFKPGFWSWEAQLQIDNGDLSIVHRPNGGTGQNTEEVVYANFPYQVKMPIVIHFILSNQNKGLFEIWVDGDIKYRKTNINFGFGDFDNNDVKIGDADAVRGEDSGGSLTVFKMGQYNFQTDDYDNNETRTVYYDDVSWYKGSDGFDVVNPGEGTVTVGDNNVVSMTKRNASKFAIDAGNGGANRQNVYLWSSNTSNVNQQWNEIDRGNGYYSYQKKNTNYCLDGDNGGANGQNVYLYACSNNNQNQHWLKVDSGNGHYRLQKRNAPGYSIDGGKGGANSQNLYLWSSNSENQNQQWKFNTLSLKTESLDDSYTESEIKKVENLVNNTYVYPSPFSDVLNIKQGVNQPSNVKVDIININGQRVFSKEITSINETLQLEKLPAGLYIAKITSVEGVQTIRITKK